jgi:hypothetical protein
MKLLASNFEPLNTRLSTYVETWTKLFDQSDSLNIAVGYASNDSVLYLKSLIEWNQPKRLNLCVGMANFDGMYQSQFYALQELNTLLLEHALGGVYLANQFPFHGKIQTFSKANQYLSGLVGSSNLSNIIPPKGIYRGNYEIDLVLNEQSVVGEIDSVINDLIQSGAIPLEASAPRLKIKPDVNPLMEGRFEVATVNNESLERVKSQLTTDRFEIPLKGTPKSNMNVFFGKGRDNNRGFVAPRPWYEVEIIPGREAMRSAPNYPDHEEFIVYTDDHYKFVLYTGGDNNKNLRSRDDLTTVGRWLKGRLEMNGALESGKIVDDEVFRKYGRNTMTLTRANKTELDEVSGKMLQVWFADFGIRR